MMETINIHCNECNSLLFSTSTQQWGAIGCEAQNKGFIYKIPILFTSKYERLFFCSKDCQKLFYDKNIPKNENISELLSKMKSEIPEKAKEISCKMAELVEISNNGQKKFPFAARLTSQLLHWGAFCNKGEKRAVYLDQLYSNFEKDFNPQKGETQKSEFDKWIEKFKSGDFFPLERSFDVYINQAYRTIFFTRIK